MRAQALRICFHKLHVRYVLDQCEQRCPAVTIDAPICELPLGGTLQILWCNTKLQVVTVENSEHSLEENVAVNRETDALVTLDTTEAA